MKVLKFIETHKPTLGLLVFIPFFSAGGWAMWQEHLVGVAGLNGPTKLQSIGVAFKGATRYVTPNQAQAYNLGHDLFNDAFVYLIGVGIIAILIKRIGARARHEA